MVPQQVMWLDVLPLTPNGKLNRRALPQPDAMQSAVEYAAPRTPLEHDLALIWQEVLTVERVGIHDNFFELGGHSLLAVKLASSIRQKLGMDVVLAELFARPTLAALAAACEQAQNEAHDHAQTQARDAAAVPPNLILDSAQAITPDMLTLIALDQPQIDTITRAVPGGAAKIADIYPLAPLQEGILFHHLMNREGDAYLLATQLVLDSQAQVDAFIAALQQVIQRHEVLRTAVLWEGLAQPVQVVCRQAPVTVEHFEADPASGLNVAAQLEAHYSPSRYRVDVRRAPMLRVAVAADLADPAKGRRVMQLLSHHLIADHTTLGLLVEEIQLILRGRQAELMAPVPFRNFAAQAILGVGKAAHEAFFKQMLGSVQEPTIPFGLLEVQGNGSDIGEASLDIDASLSRRLRRQARSLGVSVASVMHLAWARVLAAASGRQDVVFGTVLFARMQGGAGVERAMGMLMNTLPLRVPMAGLNVRQAVLRTHTGLAELLRHQHASLAMALRCSQVDAGRPLFSALLNYRHTAPAAQGGADLAGGNALLGGIQQLVVQERTNYPVSLMVDDFGADFRLTAQVSAAVPASRVCAYMHEALGQLVHALETAPQRRVQAIGVLPTAERSQLLNDTAVPRERSLSVHGMFEAQVLKTPDAVAIDCEGQALSYAQLNARANQLAHGLKGRGVRPDSLVALCMHRSVEMVVAMLGVLKAQAAYVPLDPHLPDERLSRMLQDCAPVLVLTQTSMLSRAPQGVPALALDSVEAAATLDAQPGHNPGYAIHPAQLAYCIYTSGSTGMPKGAMNTHEAVVNRLLWMHETYGLGGQDAVLQKTPYAFDVSVWEFFWPLLAGARLVVARPEGHKDPHYLAQCLIGQGVTTLHFVPSMLQAFLDAAPDVAGHRVRQIFFSGEALPAALMRRCLAAFPQAQLHNLYGPTEAAVDVTAWHCGETDAGETVPLGQAIANVQMHVVDEDFELVPLGVAGQIAIAGVALARGYLNRADLSADKFVPNPFCEPGSRMYLTGDLGRRGPNGQLEYLGRIDQQVKIRGFRIELGEIEAALRDLPQVRDAAVQVVQAGAGRGGAGDRRLVAYVVARPEAREQEGHEPDAHTLRGALAHTLPEYMVPQQVMWLDALPLTPNGKLDRKSLPQPQELQTTVEYVEPRTGTQRDLVQIWREVLRVERVGVHDNFFELGGHSLLLLEVHRRLAAMPLRPVTVIDLFHYPTVSQLAVLLHSDVQEAATQIRTQVATAAKRGEQRRKRAASKDKPR
ncbi:MAG: amino acid adenylation domain-containing protein [Comamonadaceae bacterium]|nr:MAG: amino acid adenylation domain-containing protein [Comamonadaceae bacterium]